MAGNDLNTCSTMPEITTFYTFLPLYEDPQGSPDGLCLGVNAETDTVTVRRTWLIWSMLLLTQAFGCRRSHTNMLIAYSPWPKLPLEVVGLRKRKKVMTPPPRIASWRC